MRRNEWSTSDHEQPILPVQNRMRRRSDREHRRKKDRLSRASICFIVCLGAVSAFVFQPRESISDMANIAADIAASATHKASGFMKQPGGYSPYSKVYDDIEQAWKKANADTNSKVPHPITLAHEFESNKWYSEKLHPAGQGLQASWIRVLSGFMKDLSVADFSENRIVNLYNMNANNLQWNCVLVRIRSGRASFEKAFSNTKHGRYASVVYMVESILAEKGHGMPDFTFLVMLNDGHNPTVPTFGSARHWKSWNNLIPIPMGNSRGEVGGWGTPIMGWDHYIDSTVKSKRIDYPWKTKINRAVFRGALLMQSYKLGTCNVENKGKCVLATKWDQVNRGVMYKKSQSRPDLFDIAFTKVKSKDDQGEDQMKGAPFPGSGMPFVDLQKYKYILSTGSNQDWAERLRSLLFMNSAVILHQAETMEFFYPLLEPWKHFVPTNLMFTDLVRNVKWALSHGPEVQKVVENMNTFADTYITERSMKMYWKLAMFEYAVRQRLASGKLPDKIRGKEATATIYIPPHHLHHPAPSDSGRSEFARKLATDEQVVPDGESTAVSEEKLQRERKKSTPLSSQGASSSSDGESTAEGSRGEREGAKQTEFPDLDTEEGVSQEIKHKNDDNAKGKASPTQSEEYDSKLPDLDENGMEIGTEEIKPLSTEAEAQAPGRNQTAGAVKVDIE